MSDGFTMVTVITILAVLLYVLPHAGPVVLAGQYLERLEVTVMPARR